VIDTGDFMEMKLSGYAEDMEMNGYFRFEFTGEETITVKGESYDCVVGTMSGYGDIDSDYGVTGTFTASGTIWMEKDTGDEIKDTFIMEMKMEYKGEQMTMRTEETEILISEESTWTSSDDPEIGDTWIETTVSEVTTVDITITEDGKEKDTDTDTETTVEYHEYIKDKTITTDLGTYECCVIKSYDEDNKYYSDYDYDLDYSCKKDELPIKFESYEDGDLSMEMELIAYELAGFSGGKEVIGSLSGEADEEEDGMLGMGTVAGVDTFVLIIVALIVVVLLILVGIMMGKKKSHGIQPEPYGQAGAVQPQPPPPPSTHYCQTCGGQLEYIDQYQKWYCSNCRNYL
jgi:hypothetical protein